LVTLVPVDGIVTRTRHDNVLGVYVTTIKLNPVVSVVVDLQVLDLSTITNTVERKSIDFVTISVDQVATFRDDNVFKHAAVIVRR